MNTLRVGVDIGGTFTDLCVLDQDGIVAIGKTLTTHHEPAAGVERVLADTFAAHHLDFGDVVTVVHGTTLVTNALIERRGAATALITTRGFRDVIEMAREHRYDLYDLDLEHPRPLVPRHLRLEVTERVLADGTVHTPLATTEVKQAATELAQAGIEAVAVCFLHSHLNDTHERQAREMIESVAPKLRVALSSEINPQIREYERASTTLANVYVQSRVETYLADLRKRLAVLGVPNEPLIMLSNGGVATIPVASAQPIRMLESGPAGGALAAVAFGRTGHRPNQIAFDMGGTTAKMAVIESGRPLITHTFEVDRVHRLQHGSGLPVRTPVIDMIEIGTGGGSIARIGALGLITVGPDSAGSDPGPVSYALGGTACTVTDADLVLGYLDPDRFLGGTMPLDIGAATAAIEEQIAAPMGISVPEAAWGIHATANESMANAARVHATERGLVPTTLPLFVSGGNGPLHGPAVGKALGCPSVIAPPAAGVLSAVGFLSAPISMDTAQSGYVRLSELPLDEVEQRFGDLEADMSAVLIASGLSPAQIQHERTVEMRFAGQGSEIEVPVPATSPNWREQLANNFVELYRRRFGDAIPIDIHMEILTWRVTSTGPDPHAVLAPRDTSDNHDALLGHRRAWFPAHHDYVDTPVYDRYALRPNARLNGPALIHERESTVVLDPEMSATLAEDGTLVIALRTR